MGVKRSMATRRICLVTTTRARSLRRGMTDVEHVLWQALRGKQLGGYRFRRQHPIGRYIADFTCIEQKPVIELDGGQHQEQLAYDKQRTASLQAQGWQVLRFWNNDVLNNLDGVLTTIVENLTALPPPQPYPCKGEGIWVSLGTHFFLLARRKLGWR
ncbi:MAG TPA: endonuclease domain-containing protein [Gallionella sp.]|nr:endonuclease domain-containing protein [Gallionella sp.]